MICNIIKTIDFNKLDLAINDFYIDCGHRKEPYLIMSTETIKLFKTCFNFEYPCKTLSYPVYRGYTICICDKIPYGEIELR